jgi:hypothetical protein
MHHARAVPKLGIEAHRESMNSLLWVTTPHRRATHYHSALLQEEQVRRLPAGGLSDLACRRGGMATRAYASQRKWSRDRLMWRSIWKHPTVNYLRSLASPDGGITHQH